MCHGITRRTTTTTNRTNPMAWDESKAWLQGRGYDLHQDCDVEINDTAHWKPQADAAGNAEGPGDGIYLPRSSRQHQNNPDARREWRLNSVNNRIYKACRLNDLGQLEVAA